MRGCAVPASGWRWVIGRVPSRDPVTSSLAREDEAAAGARRWEWLDSKRARVVGVGEGVEVRARIGVGDCRLLLGRSLLWCPCSQPWRRCCLAPVGCDFLAVAGSPQRELMLCPSQWKVAGGELSGWMEALGEMREGSKLFFSGSLSLRLARPWRCSTSLSCSQPWPGPGIYFCSCLPCDDDLLSTSATQTLKHPCTLRRGPNHDCRSQQFLGPKLAVTNVHALHSANKPARGGTTSTAAHSSCAMPK